MTFAKAGYCKEFAKCIAGHVKKLSRAKTMHYMLILAGLRVCLANKGFATIAVPHLFAESKEILQWKKTGQVLLKLWVKI